MDRFSERVLVMVLCGGKGERLYPLTKDRAKPSVPILGTYRIIDFSLSNALNSGLRRIALLTQYKSLSLERHVRSGWNIFHPESGDYVISLPAQGRVADHWYEGTADAVFQNIYTIQQESPETVVILSGDHVYRADYRRALAFRAERDADAVVLARVVPLQEASRFGVIQVDGEHRIVDFLEKPKRPPALPGDPDKALISMGVYIFRTPVLIKALLKDARSPSSSHDFGKDILPRLIGDHAIFAGLFDDYWEDIGTIDAYWRTNMDFLRPEPPIRLMDPAWPIRSHKPQFPPVLIEGGDVRASLLGAGCVLAGCRVQSSVLSQNVRVGEGADIAESVVFEDVEIGRGARLRRTIVDKHAVIPPGFSVGEDEERDAHAFKISRGGVRVVPKRWVPE